MERFSWGKAVNEAWSHVVCPGCECVCDDIALQSNDAGSVTFEPHCDLGRTWFQKYAQPCQATATVEGQPVDPSAAINRAAEILNSADYPLIYGLSRSSTPGQRAAIMLAEQLRGVVDTTASLCHGPSIMALQEVGEVTSTLGEVRNRADLVIFWGCNPADSHPRHAERYSVFPQGRLLPGGRSDRKVVMIGSRDQVKDWRLDPQGSRPDLVIALEPDRDFEALSQLRLLLNDSCRDDASEELRQLMNLMRECRYGVVFFGLGLAKTAMWSGTFDAGSNTGHIDVAALLKLVAELNSVTRFTARRMRLQGDVSGADSVMCWQTGYPFGVDYSRGFPRYNPGEYTANELLERQDVNACLLVGAETVRFFSDAAKKHLKSIPTVLLDYPHADPEFSPTVSITSAVYGIHAAGTIYRMDNVPLSLRRLWDTNLPTDAYVLSEISSQCHWN